MFRASYRVTIHVPTPDCPCRAYRAEFRAWQSSARRRNSRNHEPHGTRRRGASARARTYQLSDAPIDVHHSLAEAAKRVPKGVVCLVSALVFHGLTDQLPRQVWLAVGQKDWSPKPERTPLRLVRFTDRLETHAVEEVTVRVFGVAKTIADCSRYRNKIGLSLAIEGLQEALRSAKRRRARLLAG